jgi:hypothetical protein
MDGLDLRLMSSVKAENCLAEKGLQIMTSSPISFLIDELKGFNELLRE